LGVELEIDDGGEYGSTAEKLMAIGNRDAENIYIKHDGSLNEGNMDLNRLIMKLSFYMDYFDCQEH